jgi:hypothetical protein
MVSNYVLKGSKLEDMNILVTGGAGEIISRKE